MRYSAKIEATILKQIMLEPEREIILPDWAYGKAGRQPQVTIQNRRQPLVRHLYEVLISELPTKAWVANPVGVDPRNVNPHLAIVLPSSRIRVACSNGHPYQPVGFDPKIGYRCPTCREARLVGRPSPTEINAAKTHCPEGHRYTRENTVRLKSGRRRCRICARNQTARWRAKQKQEKS